MTDPLASISDAEFRRHFRFDTDNVRRLVDMLQPNLDIDSDRGIPLSPIQQLCLALNFYGGGHFQQIAGLCGGVSQPTAHRCIKRVTESLCQLKPQHIMMPTRQQMQETAWRMEDKYDLPRFAYGVDGVVVRFASKPRGVPEGNVGQNYWNRKNCFAINCQAGVYSGMKLTNLIYIFTTSIFHIPPPPKKISFHNISPHSELGSVYSYSTYRPPLIPGHC
jgi:hypothetical protein